METGKVEERGLGKPMFLRKVYREVQEVTKIHKKSAQKNLELQELLATKQLEYMELKIAQEKIKLQKLQENKTLPDNDLPIVDNPVPVNEISKLQ